MPPKPTPSGAAPTLPTPQPSSAAAAAALAAAAVTAAAAAGLSSSSTTSAKVKQPPKQKKPAGGSVGKTKPSSTATIVPTSSSSSGGGVGVGGASKTPGASTLPLHKKPLTVATSLSAPLSSSSTTATSTTNSEKQLAQFKIERAQIAERELAEMDAIERAFREDATVWNGPTNVIFPRRYHASPEIIASTTPATSQSTKQNQQHQHYYGSQSRGWMYSEGYAGIGGRSWMEATTTSTPSAIYKQQHEQQQQQHHNTTKKNPSFLLDDVTIIENSLRANGLSRQDITPTAYACLLEQARRYTYELLANAQDYAIHANRNSFYSLLPADILLAAEMLADENNTNDDGGGVGGSSGVGGIHGVASTLPTPEELLEFAATVNRVPLPPIPSNCYNGVALPPVEEQLTSRTYDVVNGARVVQRMMRGGDLPLTLLGDSLGAASGGGGGGGTSSRGGHGGVGSGGTMTMKSSSGEKVGGTNSRSTVTSSMKSKSTMLGSYGAGQGRQIAVRLKSKTSSSGTIGIAAGSSSGGTTSAGVGGGIETRAPMPTPGMAAVAAAAKLGARKGQKRSLREL
ncbi:hypothetical protein ACHAWU_007559 [Discostella pseudostelligera]|uniref:Transcription initiation factor TFIID subunit 8 n=1 Tax=Discostella pseudostelligera TaxID=259834 RepID=A0ABD3M6Y1_9STRA